MSVTNGYITLDEARDLLRDQLTGYDKEYERAIGAASRQVDDYCGRQFWKSASAEARTFRTSRPDICFTGDIANTTGLVVKTDDDEDGTFETTWTIDTDFVLEPFERRNGRPYEYLGAVGSKVFPIPATTTHNGTVLKGRRPLVQVTAYWGWDAVPDEIKMAVAIQTVDNFKAKDLTHVAATYGNEVRVARDYSPGMHGRKVKFSRTRAPLLNPQAEALISTLRHTVVA